MTLDFVIIVVLALWVFVCEKRIRNLEKALKERDEKNI